MRRSTLLLLLLVTSAGCARAPAAPWSFEEGPAPLGYALPEPDVARYGFGDTTAFSIQTGPMGVMRLLMAESGIAELEFRRTGVGLEAVVRVVEYSGLLENPAHGFLRADAGDIDGTWVVRLDAGGRVQLVDTPALSAAAREIAGAESLVRPLFVHLPAAAAEAGTVWVDTVSLTETTADAESRAWSIVTSTLVGDTVVAGRQLVLIRTEAATQVEVEGTSGGVRILQRMSGTLLGSVLWDAAASTLVERSESGELRGTLELPALGFDRLPVEAVVRRAVSLRP